MARPAYRLLLAPVPGEPAGFEILDVVRKHDMARSPQRFIQRAQDNFEFWIREVYGSDDQVNP